jgi:hypothetical protein
MSDAPWTESLTTSTEFETALRTLLTAAEQNDIDIEGSWVYHADEATEPNWEVLICELE